jgi:hypothetical protein
MTLVRLSEESSERWNIWTAGVALGFADCKQLPASRCCVGIEEETECTNACRKACETRAARGRRRQRKRI